MNMVFHPHISTPGIFKTKRIREKYTAFDTTYQITFRWKRVHLYYVWHAVTVRHTRIRFSKAELVCFQLAAWLFNNRAIVMPSELRSFLMLSIHFSIIYLVLVIATNKLWDFVVLIVVIVHVIWIWCSSRVLNYLRYIPYAVYITKSGYAILFEHLGMRPKHQVFDTRRCWNSNESLYTWRPN